MPEFLSPAKVHEMEVPLATDTALRTVNTRLAPLQAVVPAGKPVQERAEVGATVVSKLVPATVTFAMLPVVAVVKATVAETPVAPTTLPDKATGKAVNIAGNATPVNKSMVALVEPVVIETVATAA